jgi:Lon protease-like protein
MTNFIPLFPLGIVVYPGEALNLHIFEPRYRQLMGECFEESKPFGIPTVINNQVRETGTLVTLLEIVTRYDDGRMDIRVKGEQLFRMLEMVQSIPGKLYSGAIVHYPANRVEPHPRLQATVLAGIRELHKWLNVSKNFRLPDHELSSYDIAHHAGLSLEQEYELLELLDEWQRLEYLRRHLQTTLPMMAEMESLKEKIKLNGHFREIKGWEPE